ncbi:MAG TPA: Uma2 family endonuclease [Thermoanaerobaculia bacterium]|nr:Uma2 family endonuclease [Thermoanaerobaculia bacterium]
MPAIPFRQDVYYPESDGKPMGETEIHIREIMYLFQALSEYLRNVSEVYVGADMLLYYVEGNPRRFVVPDVFVVKGVPRGERRIFKVWAEGRPPCLIIEVTSDSTRDEDFVGKKDLYERLGVEEYVLHDPLGDYLNPPLQAFRLVRGRYQPIRLESDASFQSQATGVTLRREGRSLRVIDTETGEPILSNEEVREELARLRAEIERLRGQG